MQHFRLVNCVYIYIYIYAYDTYIYIYIRIWYIYIYIDILTSILLHHDYHYHHYLMASSMNHTYWLIIWIHILSILSILYMACIHIFSILSIWKYTLFRIFWLGLPDLWILTARTVSFARRICMSLTTPSTISSPQTPGHAQRRYTEWSLNGLLLKMAQEIADFRQHVVIFHRHSWFYRFSQRNGGFALFCHNYVSLPEGNMHSVNFWILLYRSQLPTGTYWTLMAAVLTCYLLALYLAASSESSCMFLPWRHVQSRPALVQLGLSLAHHSSLDTPWLHVSPLKRCHFGAIALSDQTTFCQYSSSTRWNI